jgi:hypothetical protein
MAHKRRAKYEQEYPYQHPYVFVKVISTRLSYGFITAQDKLKFFDAETGKFCELENLHEIVATLPVDERLSFWDYLVRKDLYLELLKKKELSPLPSWVKQHVSQTYSLRR